MLETRTETAKKSGKTALWAGAGGSAEEKADAGGALANGSVILPFHVRAGDGMTLSFTVWDEDVTKRTADVFLGAMLPYLALTRVCLCLPCLPSVQWCVVDWLVG